MLVHVSASMLPTHVRNWSNAADYVDAQKLAFNDVSDDLFVSFEHGLLSVKCEMWLVPKALYNLCSCVHVLCLHVPLSKWECVWRSWTVHLNCRCPCLWHLDAPLISVCVHFFIIVCACVVSEMNKCIDTVPWAPLYYFWFIVQHKQFDNLIPFHLALAIHISC